MKAVEEELVRIPNSCAHVREHDGDISFHTTSLPFLNSAFPLHESPHIPSGLPRLQMPSGTDASVTGLSDLTMAQPLQGGEELMAEADVTEVQQLPYSNS